MKEIARFGTRGGGMIGGSMAHASTIILTGPWIGRRAIRTTTGRALRVGRWTAPKPVRYKKEVTRENDPGDFFSIGEN